MEKNKFYWLLHDFNLGEKKELMRCINVEWHAFNQELLSHCNEKLGNSWPKGISVSFSGSEGLDYFTCSKHLDVVSESAKTVIESISKDEIEFLPIISVMDPENMLFPKKYWAIHIKSFDDALVWEKTRWVNETPPERNDPTAILDLIKPCLNYDLIKDKTILRLEIAGIVSSRIYISRRLKKGLIAAGCTLGMDFSSVYVE